MEKILYKIITKLQYIIEMLFKVILLCFFFEKMLSLARKKTVNLTNCDKIFPSEL